MARPKRYLNHVVYQKAWLDAHPGKSQAYQKAYKKRHPERIKQAYDRQNSRRQRERRTFLSIYKTERGCMDCGYNKHPAALDFDHRPGTIKVANVSVLWGNAIEELMTEIGKCDIVCANCHRIRTWQRRRSRFELD